MKDLIPRGVLLLALESLDQGEEATMSTWPLVKLGFRHRCNLAAIILREAMPPDAFDDEGRVIPLAANDPLRKGPTP